MNSTNKARNPSTPVFKSTRLLDQCREQLRYLHYSLRTEEVYLGWVKKFTRFHGLRHPRDMAQAEVEQFLTHLAVERRVFRVHTPAGFECLVVSVSTRAGRGVAVDGCARATGSKEANPRRASPRRGAARLEPPQG